MTSPLHSLIEARQAELAREFPELVCENETLVSRGTMHARFVVTGRTRMKTDKLKSFHTQTIIAILEAQCALWEGRKFKGEPSADASDATWAAHHSHNIAIDSITASNRELLKTLQS